MPDNGVIRPSYLAVMLLTWIMFGVLGCLNVPMLALWMVLGVFTVVIGFLQVCGGGGGEGGRVLGFLQVREGCAWPHHMGPCVLSPPPIPCAEAPHPTHVIRMCPLSPHVTYLIPHVLQLGPVNTAVTKVHAE